MTLTSVKSSNCCRLLAMMFSSVFKLFSQSDKYNKRMGQHPPAINGNTSKHSPGFEPIKLLILAHPIFSSSTRFSHTLLSSSRYTSISKPKYTPTNVHMYTQNTHVCMNASVHIHPHTQAGMYTCIYSREHVHQHATHTITPPPNNHQTLYNPWSQHETATVYAFTDCHSSRRIKADRQNCCYVILSTTSPQNAYHDQESFAQCMTYTFPARHAVTKKRNFHSLL